MATKVDFPVAAVAMPPSNLPRDASPFALAIFNISCWALWTFSGLPCQMRVADVWRARAKLYIDIDIDINVDAA